MALLARFIKDKEFQTKKIKKMKI